MNGKMHCRIVLALCLGLCAAHGIAGAQTAADKAAADTLFNEGKKQMAAGDTAGACDKFEASLARVTQLGTQIALASCFEKLGKTASAWGQFRAAASAAAKAHDKRQRFAEEHATALEPRLSKLVIKLEPGDRVDGLEVKRDDQPVAAAELGTPMPVDPGEHLVAASAPGWVAWSTKVSVAATPGVVEVTVPALEKPPAKLDEPKPPPPPAPVATDGAGRSRRAIAYAVGGGGAAIVGVSLVFGAVARSRWNSAQSHCQDRQCDEKGVDLAHSARTFGNLSTATFAIGAVAVATGVYFYLTAPSSGMEKSPSASSAVRISPSIGPAQVGLTVAGGF
ncbi:MAG TPA: hypothetical protein VFK02_13565 [Kofleriaceae bacterium]|nr:hypothetical protein [Kofleriaceae bacterium]